VNVLVTGGAGFIGSHLVDALLEQGHRVTALDNLSTGRTANISHQSGNPGLRFVDGDVCDERLVDSLVRDCETVYHLAAAVGVKHVIEDPLRGIMTNAFGSETIIRLAYRHGARLLLASTSEIYGKGAGIPFREEDDRLLGPTSVPRWSYSTSKALAEHLAFSYAAKGLTMSIVRYCNAYGPRTDERGYGSVVAKFVNQALKGEPITIYGGGFQTRCFNYVEDSVRGTMLAATKPEAIGQAFNLGSDEEISISELAWLAVQAVGSKSPVVHVPFEEAYGDKFEETVRRIPAVDKADRLLGFRHEIPLSEGLQKTVEWFRERH
jgi:UDP-glucose 4-epimerase